MKFLRICLSIMFFLASGNVRPEDMDTTADFLESFGAIFFLWILAYLTWPKNKNK